MGWTQRVAAGINLYAYASNNPIRNADRSGLDDDDEVDAEEEDDFQLRLPSVRFGLNLQLSLGDGNEEADDGVPSPDGELDLSTDSALPATPLFNQQLNLDLLFGPRLFLSPAELLDLLPPPFLDPNLPQALPLDLPSRLFRATVALSQEQIAQGEFTSPLQQLQQLESFRPRDPFAPAPSFDLGGSLLGSAGKILERSGVTGQLESFGEDFANEHMGGLIGLGIFAGLGAVTGASVSGLRGDWGPTQLLLHGTDLETPLGELPIPSPISLVPDIPLPLNDFPLVGPIFNGIGIQVDGRLSFEDSAAIGEESESVFGLAPRIQVNVPLLPWLNVYSDTRLNFRVDPERESGPLRSTFNQNLGFRGSF
ncbi:MAG: hypothetical protein AAF206_18585 [Bacteroidota bacterium]